MNEFTTRQLAQMRFAIADFRNGDISLSALLSRLEGSARAVGQGFWENDIFDTAFALEQINADLVEERRGLTSAEQEQVDALIVEVETRLSRIV